MNKSIQSWIYNMFSNHRIRLPVIVVDGTQVRWIEHCVLQEVKKRNIISIQVFRFCAFLWVFVFDFCLSRFAWKIVLDCLRLSLSEALEDRGNHVRLSEAFLCFQWRNPRKLWNSPFRTHRRSDLSYDRKAGASPPPFGCCASRECIDELNCRMS